MPAVAGFTVTLGELWGLLSWSGVDCWVFVADEGTGGVGAVVGG